MDGRAAIALTVAHLGALGRDGRAAIARVWPQGLHAGRMHRSCHVQPLRGKRGRWREKTTTRETAFGLPPGKPSRGKGPGVRERSDRLLIPMSCARRAKPRIRGAAIPLPPPVPPNRTSYMSCAMQTAACISAALPVLMRDSRPTMLDECGQLKHAGHGLVYSLRLTRVDILRRSASDTSSRAGAETG